MSDLQLIPSRILDTSQFRATRRCLHQVKAHGNRRSPGTERSWAVRIRSWTKGPLELNTGVLSLLVHDVHVSESYTNTTVDNRAPSPSIAPHTDIEVPSHNVSIMKVIGTITSVIITRDAQVRVNGSVLAVPPVTMHTTTPPHTGLRTSMRSVPLAVCLL